MILNYLFMLFNVELFFSKQRPTGIQNHCRRPGAITQTDERERDERKHLPPPLFRLPVAAVLPRASACGGRVPASPNWTLGRASNRARTEPPIPKPGLMLGRASNRPGTALRRLKLPQGHSFYLEWRVWGAKQFYYLPCGRLSIPE